MKSKGLTRTADLLKILAEGEYEIKGIEESSANFTGVHLYTFRGAEFYMSDPDLRDTTKGVLRIPPVVYVKFDGGCYKLNY